MQTFGDTLGLLVFGALIGISTVGVTAWLTGLRDEHGNRIWGVPAVCKYTDPLGPVLGTVLVLVPLVPALVLGAWLATPRGPRPAAPATLTPTPAQPRGEAHPPGPDLASLAARDSAAAMSVRLESR